METGILSDVKGKRSKSARQTQMHLSVYATSNDTSNLLTPLLSRFIKLNLPEYNLETFIEICQSSDMYGNIPKMFEKLEQ